jgi:Ca2+-binding RTX toxin-like protein
LGGYDSLIGGAGAETLAGSGGDTLVGGTGATLMYDTVGASPATTFQFNQGFGQDTIGLGSQTTTAAPLNNYSTISFGAGIGPSNLQISAALIGSSENRSISSSIKSSCAALASAVASCFASSRRRTMFGASTLTSSGA